MNDTSKLETFQPYPPDTAGVLSWIHIGDLHMRSAGEQNDRDLQAIVSEINRTFAKTISFVYLPGDNADHGDESAYGVVREALERLEAPWCAIVGDHDVEQKKFDHFRTYLAERTRYSFAAGRIRFVALNAFDVPEPPSFTMLPEQIRWLELQLRDATSAQEETVLLLHCYPSDLKHGGQELSRLVRQYGVMLVDMGHTHYNEISNDGGTIYTATRSTGQVEEGAVGFSVTNVDEGVVSWRFLELGKLPAVMITSPSDERLLPDAVDGVNPAAETKVRAKVWSDETIISVEATCAERSVSLQQIPGSNVWQGVLPPFHLGDDVCPLRVVARTSGGKDAQDEIALLVGGRRSVRMRAARDQDNALEAWPEHGLVGTQLGPNKNGRKW